jgi:hypothetical protein
VNAAILGDKKLFTLHGYPSILHPPLAAGNKTTLMISVPLSISRGTYTVTFTGIDLHY